MSPNETGAKNENDEDTNKGSSDNNVSRGGARDPRLALSSTVPSLPTFKNFYKFAIPCLGLWVAGPLLSLVDTAFVGLSSPGAESAKQLAALGPATTFFDGATYLFAFLNVATTNLYGSARAQAGEDSERAESVVRSAAKVSLNCGIGIMFFLLAFCRPLLALYIGMLHQDLSYGGWIMSTISLLTLPGFLTRCVVGDKAALTPGLLDSAVDYVMIRAFSMPTSLLMGVLQAALLGAKDSVTPLIAILYSTIFNVVGDYILVNRFHMGLQGASLATLVAQLAGTFALLGPARRKLVKSHNLGLFQRKTQAHQDYITNGDGVSGRAFLAFAAPVLTLIVGKLAAFGFMTHAAAAVPGQPTPLASHQIILSLFFFVSPFLEVISQTAQTFLPPFIAPLNDYIVATKEKNPNYQVETDERARPWIQAAFIVAGRLLRIGTSVAAVVATIASCVPAFFGNWITSDLVVQQSVKPLAPYLWAGAFLTAPVAVSEGVLLARRELTFLATVYLATIALLPPAFLKVKFSGGTVTQVWGVFALFQLFRAICFGGRIWSGSIRSRVGQPKTIATNLESGTQVSRATSG